VSKRGWRPSFQKTFPLSFPIQGEEDTGGEVYKIISLEFLDFELLLLI
jgi:hypothetical protein